MATVEAIDTVYLEADAASVTFSSVPSTYHNLEIRCSMRSRYNTTNSYDTLYIQLNNISTGYYTYHQHYASQSSVAGGGAAGANGSYLPFASTESTEGEMYGCAVVDMVDYTSTSKFKTVQSLTQTAELGVPASYVVSNSGLFYSTAAVTTIKLVPYSGNNLVRGTVISLYGWRN